MANNFDATLPAPLRYGPSDRPRATAASRWEEWRPIVALWMVTHSPSCDLTDIFMAKHAAWIGTLFAARIPITIIRRYVLDDPCVCDAMLKRRLAEYLQTRKRRT
jgi:hypothetical protein